jgi:hypothetical protein
MRSLLLAATLAVGLSLVSALPAFADTLPSVEQIYQAEQAGHMDQAQQMISQVLKERPNSAKAHFIQAEIFAKQNYLAQARAELNEAERLDASEDFAKPHALQELKAQLGAGERPVAGEHRSTGGQMVQYPRSETHFPWGTLLIAAIVIGLLMMVFRRRSTVQQYPAGGSGFGGAPGAGYGPGYGPPPMGGGGIGSGIVGGLASGLAVGAGVVAGEEVAHHFLDGDRHEGGSGFIPSADAAQPDFNANADSGGNDFGVNDPGSWDDSGGGGGGGDDWS